LRIGELLALQWSEVELTTPIERRGDENWSPWLMVNGQITSKGKRVGYGKTDAADPPHRAPGLGCSTAMSAQGRRDAP
jgi:hypothetical protein